MDIASHIEQIYTGCLSQGSYFLHSNGEAVVIDPLRESKPYIEKAKSLRPIHQRLELGREVLLFEDTEMDKLSNLGEVRPPFIADLFMAIMDKTKTETEA